jgi:hypothetical protein
MTICYMYSMETRASARALVRRILFYLGIRAGLSFPI